MYKSDLIKEVASRTGVTQKQTEEFYDVLFNVIKEGLKEDGFVELVRNMTFKVKPKKARKGVLNEEEWISPEGEKVIVKLSKLFIDEILDK
jgi:nucleoid DNA-binding protein